MSVDFTNFTVPRFNGFEDAMDNEEEVENYFEYDHENNQHLEVQVDDNISSEYDFDFNATGVSKDAEISRHPLRKSISAGNLLTASEVDRRQELISEEHCKVSCCDSEIGLKKSKKGGRNCKQNGTQYISMAELASKFWMKTPERYRSKSKIGKMPVGCTIPKSPQFKTDARSRPVTVLSRDQIEEMEMLEFQKNQIKARPLNKKILAQPKMPMPVIKKEATVPKPFKLTETHMKKQENVPIAAQPFHARGIPKSLYIAPKELKVPLNRKPLSRCSSKSKLNEKPPTPVKVLTKTELEPFSFDRRDKAVMQKKENFIKKVIEEEKKAREFRARPIPKTVLTKLNGALSSTSIKSSKSDEDLDAVIKPFKATIPKVLYREPFVPKRVEIEPLAEITSFYLNTELRAKEREKFDRKLQEKEEEQNKMRALREQEEKEKEEDQIHKLRKETEFKANPVRRFKEFQVIPLTKVTVPNSPNFTRVKVKKENLNK